VLKSALYTHLSVCDASLTSGNRDTATMVNIESQKNGVGIGQGLTCDDDVLSFKYLLVVRVFCVCSVYRALHLVAVFRLRVV
jgi:hypothetical protein